MNKDQKTKRTQLSDLPVAEKELTGQEMAQVQGGTTAANFVPVSGITSHPLNAKVKSAKPFLRRQNGANLRRTRIH